VTEAPVLVVPSPKFQLKLYGDVPPVALAVKVTGVLTVGLDELNVKVVVSGGGVLAPKNSVITGAPASLASVDSPQFCSTV